MKKIRLDIVTLSHSVTQSHNYAVILGEQDGKRRLPVVIGGFEAQAIAVALENMSPNRPLTHDLFKNTLDIFDIQCVEVIINNLVDGIFYAQLVCHRSGEYFEVDSRTSDAIAMAVRFGCPIYTFESILDTAGVLLDEDGEKRQIVTSGQPHIKDEYKSLSIEALQKMLSDVLDKEDYEKAAKIRDEINRRQDS